MLVSQRTRQPRAICALADFSLNMPSLCGRTSRKWPALKFHWQVGGAVSDKQISEMWHHHFSDLLTSVDNKNSKSLYLNTLMTRCIKQQFLFPPVMYVAL